MTKLNTSREAAGAEFLVLGHLLIERIEAFKTYTNYPGYDIIATNPEQNLSCRIQVKSRWATDFDGGFLIKNYDCDFVVLVCLNRGYEYKKKQTGNDNGVKSPQLYVFPIQIVKDALSPVSSWGKTFLKNMKDSAQYKDNWGLVKEFLKIKEPFDISLEVLESDEI